MTERRPNPPGWTQPKAPYNPYDPTDLRPPEGYPSEFQTPGQARNWSVSPKEPSNYAEVRNSMKKMSYTPRPYSELYPGCYKVLRRTKHNPFERGVRITSALMGTSLIFFGVFFYRWNDGYDHVFSAPYKLQLSLRDKWFGNLTERQKEDLEGRQRGFNKPAKTHATEELYMAPKPETETEATLQRPMRSHVIEAERIRQEREEAILRAVDIAEQQVKSGGKK